MRSGSARKRLPGAHGARSGSLRGGSECAALSQLLEAPPSGGRESRGDSRPPGAAGHFGPAWPRSPVAAGAPAPMAGTPTPHPPPTRHRSTKSMGKLRRWCAEPKARATNRPRPCACVLIKADDDLGSAFRPVHEIVIDLHAGGGNFGQNGQKATPESTKATPDSPRKGGIGPKTAK